MMGSVCDESNARGDTVAITVCGIAEADRFNAGMGRIGTFGFGGGAVDGGARDATLRLPVDAEVPKGALGGGIFR